MASDCSGSVLWRCESCDICFLDLNMFENHKCVTSSEHATISETCIKELVVHSYTGENDMTNESEDQETISCLSAIADGDANPGDVDMGENSPMTLVQASHSEASRSAIISLQSSLNIKNDHKKRQKAKRSLVWSYFSALDEKKALCCLCSKVIAYCGTPTNLVYHLSRFHPQEGNIVKSRQKGGLKYQYLDNKLPKAPLSVCSATIIKSAELQNAAATSASSSNTANKKISIIDRLVEMLMTDLQPVSLLQGEGFKRLINSIDPSLKVPEPKKVLQEMIPKRYYLEYKKIEVFVHDAEKIHLSIDLWVGFGEEYFATFTAHFITKYYENKSFTLCTTHMGSDPDPQALVTDLLSCVSNWELTKKVVCIVTNGPEKIAKANFQSGWTEVICFAHTLNRIITESLASSPAMAALLEKCRAVVTFLKENETAKQALRDIQTHNKQMQSHADKNLESIENKTFPLKPKKDIPSHWISMFYMLQRISTLKKVVHIVFETVASTVECLDDEDWASIEETVSLLKAFEVVTLELCSECYPSLAKVIPIVQGLLSLVDNCNTLSVKPVERVRRDLLLKLRKRIGQVENNLTYAMATVLDPRFKNIAFQSEKAVDSVIQALITEGCKHASDVLQSCVEQDTNNRASSYTDSLWEGFDKKATPKKKPASASEMVTLEINRYLEEPLIDRKKNPLMWWKDHGSARFPILAVVAREFLSIPATSVPPERVFLLKGQSFCEKRKQIKPKYVDQFLFLSMNI